MLEGFGFRRSRILLVGMLDQDEKGALMGVYELTFSPTGGTKKTAKAVLEGIGGEAVEVDLTSRDVDFTGIRLGEEDVAVVSVPSYAGRVPAVAAERIALVRGNGARAVLVCVYGNRAYEDTLVELEDVVKAAGFRPIAAVAAVAEHSIARQFASGRPDGQDVAELAAFGRKIGEKIASGEAALPTLPGNRPYREAKGVGMVPKADKGCDSCGVCAARCPVGAIDREDPKSVDKDACISCMRCVAECPRSARKLNSVMLKAAGMALKKACSEKKACELYL